MPNHEQGLPMCHTACAHVFCATAVVFNLSWQSLQSLNHAQASSCQYANMAILDRAQSVLTAWLDTDTGEHSL